MTRWKINEAAREVLEEQYLRKRFPSPLSKKRLAEQLDVAPRRIQVWFQNRRQREKAGAEDEPPAQPHGRPPRSSRAPVVDDDFDSVESVGAEDSDTGLSWPESNAREDWHDSAASQQDQDEALMEMACMQNLVGGVDASSAASSHSGQNALSPPVNFLSSSDDIFQALMGFEDGNQKAAKGAGFFAMPPRAAGCSGNLWAPKPHSAWPPHPLLAPPRHRPRVFGGGVSSPTRLVPSPWQRRASRAASASSLLTPRWGSTP